MAEFIKQWGVECVLGAVVGALGVFFTVQQALFRGMRALLRNAIIESYNKCERDQCCPIYRLEAANEMYVQYHALRGNGAVTELMERIKEYPTKPQKQENMEGIS